MMTPRAAVAGPASNDRVQYRTSCAWSGGEKKPQRVLHSRDGWMSARFDETQKIHIWGYSLPEIWPSHNFCLCRLQVSQTLYSFLSNATYSAHDDGNETHARFCLPCLSKIWLRDLVHEICSFSLWFSLMQTPMIHCSHSSGLLQWQGSILNVSWDRLEWFRRHVFANVNVLAHNTNQHHLLYLFVA